MSSLGKILVPLEGSDQDQILLATAIRAAKPYNAHVSVLYAHPDPAQTLPVVGVPFTAEAMAAVIDGNTRIFRAKAKRIHDTMALTAEAEGARVVAAPCRGDTVTLSFREATGYPPKIVSAAAALADLVVCAPAAGSSAAFDTAVDLILRERRPVLLAAGSTKSFRKVMIGWNNTVPAAHGLLAAMPFLEKADLIELVCMERPGAPDFNTDHVAGYFKAHGLAFSERHLRILGSAHHNTLAKFACDHRADLLVIGGFSHSRAHETLLGGVTSEVLHAPPLPVLLAH